MTSKTLSFVRLLEAAEQTTCDMYHFAERNIGPLKLYVLINIIKIVSKCIKKKKFDF